MSEVINIETYVKNREAREDAVTAFFQEHPEMLEVTFKELGGRKFKKADLAHLLAGLLEAVKKGCTPKAAPKAKAAPEAAPKQETKAAPKAKPATERVVKTAFPGISPGLLAKIVSMSSMSRNGLVVTFQEESHREWFHGRHKFNSKLAYASKGLTITVTKK